ncbi:MAG: cyclic nucleotide-binding domain-containing protein, partial [Gemmatimonadota bacterium]
LILVLLGFLSVRQIAFVAFVLAVLLTFAALAVRKEYVKSLAQSIRGRFASLRSTFASITGTTTFSLVREALASDEPLKVAFAFDLLERADTDDLSELAPELHASLEHESEAIRRRALEALARLPEEVRTDAVRERLFDEDAEVREAAVRTLVAASDRSPESLLSELLGEEDARVRAATLACLARDLPPETAESIVRPFFERRRMEADAAPAALRLELATAAGLMRSDPGVASIVSTLVADEDPDVASAALRSAGQLGFPELLPTLVRALGEPRLRPAARDALILRGEEVLDPLVRTLNDRTAEPRIRRNIPSVLAEIPSQNTVDALIGSYLLPDTDQVLDDRTLKALNKLRARHPELRFERERVLRAVGREIDATENYLEALAVAERIDGKHPAVGMLARALREARGERRESIFRWLGLVFPPDGMYRCYLAVTGGNDRGRANGLEWLETTVGHSVFRRLQPALRRAPEVELPPEGPEPTLRALWDDEDVWIARCAMWAMAEAGFPSTRSEIQRFDPGDPGLQRTVMRVRAALNGGPPEPVDEDDMDLIEKVFLLQEVDLLRGARSGQLALLGQIARVVEVDGNVVLIRQGEPTDALYVVIRGEVELRGVGEHVLRVGEGSPFGTWALIDEDPSLVEACTVEPTRLLKIRRVDFHDLLSDHPELGLDLLQGLARRVRTLVQA